jgi:hypothetical protein
VTAAPWDLNEAIAAATAVLGMLEAPRDDVPPEHIWHHDERLTEWYAAVEQRRKDKYRGLETVPDATDDENTVVNELAAGLRD